MPCGYLSSCYKLLFSARLQIEIALSFSEHQRFKPFSDWIFKYSFVQKNIVFNYKLYQQRHWWRSRQVREDDKRVKQVVDNGESFMHTALLMDGYGNKLQCLYLTRAQTSIALVSITNICFLTRNNRNRVSRWLSSLWYNETFHNKSSVQFCTKQSKNCSSSL